MNFAGSKDTSISKNKKNNEQINIKVGRAKMGKARMTKRRKVKRFGIDVLSSCHIS